ncbi:hypothetical protein ACWDKQ_35670, partial [Saccharopolyspora sp. NPDC000995]
SMAWLAARMAVMRFLLSRWWGQLFMRLAMAAAGGVAFNVVPDLQAQAQMLGEKSSAKWDGKLSEQSAGMGAFSALVSLPLSAVGGLVSNALTKVLVRGLGDEVDEKILEAAAKRAVDEHAEKYPVSAMARFADVVGEHLDHYAGMSVRGMWSARFGSGIGEALSDGLGELFGEVGYQAATGQEVTWNPFSVTAGVSESVFSGVGNLTGLAWRGKLHPQGPSPYLDDTSRREDTTTDGGGLDEEKTPLPGAGSGSQTGQTPGSPGKDNTFDSSDASKPSDASKLPDVSKPSDVSKLSDADSVFPVGPVDSAAVSVPSGKDPVVSAAVDVKDGKEGADGGVPGGKPARGVPEVPGSRQDRPGTPLLPAHSDGVVGSGQERPDTPPPAYSPDGVVGPGQDRSGEPLPAYSTDGVVVSGQERPDTPPPQYRPVAGGDPVPGVHGVDVSGNRPLEVPTSQTPGSPAVTPHTSGAPADAALPETVRSGSVVDSDRGVVPAGHESSPDGWTGRDGDSGVDSVAGHGDSHRQDGTAVSPDSAMPSGQGSQTAPYLQQNPAAALPVGLPADTVRVEVSADVVAGDGLAEFVRDSVADSTGGPVVLVSPGNSSAAVTVSLGQGSALAQGLERNVVAMTPGQGGRTPQWTVFGTDGSTRPLTGPGAAVPASGREGVAGLTEASTAVPVSGENKVAPEETPAAQTASAQARSVAGEVQPAVVVPGVGAGTVRDTGRIPVGQWSRSILDREIARAKSLNLSSGEKEAAGLVVRRAHDVRGLARADAVVPLGDVVALVAAKRREVGDDQQDQVVAFSQELADRLGTRRSEPIIQAGAGPSASYVESAPVAFGELKPLVEGGSEPRGGEAEYARDRSRGSLPDVVDGRRVVLSEEDLAGVSEEGSEALEAFQEATGVHARPRLAGVDGHAEDGHNVVAFLRMLDWWGVLDHAVVV